MSGFGPVPEKTRLQQERASNPDASAWVSANAGAGKTTVLVRRVIRLLLDGNPPARILCLTFTKAAAANMANKVLETLSAWVRLDDGELDKKLAEVTPQTITPALRAKARRLFAAALETPGGLKVQTIHAFCDRVLHQFPFEAKVPAGFEVLDDVREADLLQRARDAVLIEAASDPESETGRALASAVAAVSDKSLNEALAEAVRARREILRAIESGGSLQAALGLQPGETVEMIEKEILEEGTIPRAQWKHTAELLQSMDGNAVKRGDALFEAAMAEDSASAIEAYCNVFFTKDGGIRAANQFGNKGARDAIPELYESLAAECARLPGLRENLLAARACERTAALFALAGGAIRRYEELKRARGALDYSDLIDKTADLLENVAAAWVHYKLDSGIDHVLIDEAQDTSPQQWKVIGGLTAEFFAGEGASSSRARTIFAVGDEKQSIFSFQGAVPLEFDAMRRKFEQRVNAADNLFHFERFELSFRSSPGVLAAVDRVFSREAAFKGISSGENLSTAHTAIRENAPALVELWPLLEAPEDDENEIAWDAPLNAKSETSPPARLANGIAAAVKFWLSGRHAVTDRGSGIARPARAGDVIVLVRRRGVLFEAVLQALKQSGIPVAGADRLTLTEHIAVMDLIALGDALSLGSDDLSLACVLKSPLFGLSEDDLFELAHARTGSLAAALKEAAARNARYKEAAEKLRKWRSEAFSLRPFDFYSRVLGRDRGRELMLARLGPEAADAIDEFLSRALAYEQLETPSLTGFIAFLRRAGTEVKRDLEVDSPAVRVMTVHGAKGLEAPIIVLADTTSLPDSRHDPELLTVAGVPVWAPSKKNDSQSLTAARADESEKRLAEYRRLLYVALTRAADALVICGYKGKTGLPENCWYKLVSDALSEGDEPLTETEVPYFPEKILRWKPEALHRVAPEAAPEPRQIEIPAALEKPAAAPPEARPRIRPSDSDFDAGKPPADAESPATSIDPLRRGDILHRLLHFLPVQSESDLDAGARRFLQSAAADLSEPERDTLKAEALATLRHPGMADLLDAQSLPEVSFISRDAKGAEISGRIDRLLVKGEEIFILDYKTDSRPPQSIEEVPGHYVRQLALYAGAVRRIYPGKTARAILIYTSGPLLLEIPGQRLLSALTSA